MAAEDDDDKDKGDKKFAWAITALAVTLVILLADVLVQMGLQLTRKELKAVNRAAIAYPLIYHWILGPAVGIVLVLVLQLDAEWAMGLILLCCTPPTIGAAIWTYFVEGDAAVCLIATVCSLCASSVLMPFNFWLCITIINACGGSGDGDIKIQLPLGQIFGTMAGLVLLCGFGVFINERWPEECVVKLRARLKKTVGPIMIATIVFMALAPGVLSSAFYGGPGAWRYWTAVIAIHIAAWPFGEAFRCFQPNASQAVLDAVTMTCLRRNPVILLGVAAASFAGHDEVDFDKAFGITVAITASMDWVSLPMLIVMRKRRFGKIFLSGKKENESRSEVAFSSDVESAVLESDL